MPSAVVHVGDPHAPNALHQDLDRVVGQLEHLQHRGRCADAEQVLLSGLLALGIALGDEKDLLVSGHGRLERQDG